MIRLTNQILDADQKVFVWILLINCVMSYNTLFPRVRFPFWCVPWVYRWRHWWRLRSSFLSSTRCGFRPARPCTRSSPGSHLESKNRKNVWNLKTSEILTVSNTYWIKQNKKFNLLLNPIKTNKIFLFLSIQTRFINLYTSTLIFIDLLNK